MVSVEAVRKKHRYATDLAYRVVMKERARAYGQKNRERRKLYLRDYMAKKRLDPEWVAAERVRTREKQREARKDPLVRARRLEQKSTRRKLTPREAVIEKYLVEQVEAEGGLCLKFNDPGHRGAPDRLVVLSGHPTYYVEMKRPNKLGHVAEAQKRYHKKLRDRGQRVWVLNTKFEVDHFMLEVSLL